MGRTVTMPAQWTKASTERPDAASSGVREPANSPGFFRSNAQTVWRSGLRHIPSVSPSRSGLRPCRIRLRSRERRIAALRPSPEEAPVTRVWGAGSIRLLAAPADDQVAESLRGGDAAKISG